MTVGEAQTEMASTIAGSREAGLLDGVGTVAHFDNPFGLAIDHDNNIIVADTYNDCIRRITAAGTVCTISPDAEFDLDSQFDNPTGLAIDHDNNIIVAETGNNRIRRITAAGMVSTIAGSGEGGFADGVGTDVQFHWVLACARSFETCPFLTRTCRASDPRRLPDRSPQIGCDKSHAST